MRYLNIVGHCHSEFPPIGWPESIILYCTRNGINSIGVRTSDGFVVKKGSIISQKITKSCPDYVLKKRTQHKNIIDANNMLTEDILFNTP